MIMGQMKNFTGLCLSAILLFCSCTGQVRNTDTISLVNGIRPPAVPLVTVDPYFSVWSMGDEVNMTPTRHWTGKEQPMIAAVRVDGDVYRILGTVEPELTPIIPDASSGAWDARYRTGAEPSGNWKSPQYDDSSWKAGKGAFGSSEMPFVRTGWSGDGRDIWIRRTVEIRDDFSSSAVILEYSHDDVFELYINGIKVADTGNTWRNGVRVELPQEVVATLKPGKVTIAAHCHNTVGGSYVDFGLYRKEPREQFVLAAEQTSLSVLPTRTICGFTCGGIDLDLIFTAPLLMEDLELISRPVNYMTWQVRSNDGKEHDVQIYYEASPLLAVDNRGQAIVAERGTSDSIEFLKTGTAAQNILGAKGDDRRIDWGYFYLAAPSGKGRLSLGDYWEMKDVFASTGMLPEGSDTASAADLLKPSVSLAYAKDLGAVGARTVAGYILLGYDDLFSIQYFGENLRPYWNRTGDRTMAGQLASASHDYNSLVGKCERFDSELMNGASRCGGTKYAELCALAYRQAIAAHKLVMSPDGELLFFSKENFSNGSIGTVDITYPSSPMFLLYNPDLVKGMMNHIFYYSESGKWTKPFAAHDVGTYPWANGQTYGGDMPVEESGNMLILAAAIAKIEGTSEYARKHWDVITTWADYLVENGLDPANQLCTDDFAGHFAHNANLSIKAILGIASYGMLAEMSGNSDTAQKYMAIAEDMAGRWKEMAYDGDHYRLTFDKPGTWSQKYNLVWDDFLGFDLFDDDIAETELAFYRTKQNIYGLPLDCRRTYTKTDWILWTAAMSDDPEVFEEFVAPVHRFMNETTDRVPMSDWVYTDSPVKSGFQARSVVGGYFMKMLEERFEQ